MGFKALTVNTAAEAAGHIYAEDDAAIFQSMFGGDGVLNIGNCLKSTVISNNKVRISDGVLCVGGHIGRLSYADYQDMTIENGTSGYNRNDIIYAKFLANGNVDSYTLAVKKGTATTGTATDPALLQGDLYEGATERDYPLYRVKLSGLSIASVDQLFSVIPTIPDLKAQMAKDKEEINQSLVKHSHTWDSITGKPSAFPPSSSDLLNKIYPVGSIYMSINNVSPQAFIGGTWEQIKNRWLVGAGDEYAVGTYGGNAVHSHTQRMIFTANYAGNNGLMYTAGGTTPTDVIYTGETRSVPPYYAVYMWKRIA